MCSYKLAVSSSIQRRFDVYIFAHVKVRQTYFTECIFKIIFTNYNNKVQFIFKYNQGAKCHRELFVKILNDICKSNMRKLNLNGYCIRF